MITKEEVKKFIDEQLKSFDYASDFSELDSMAKLEVIIKCEIEFIISIDENEVGEGHDRDTNKLVDYILEKINNK
jgi:acyl carrier protein